MRPPPCPADTAALSRGLGCAGVGGCVLGAPRTLQSTGCSSSSECKPNTSERGFLTGTCQLGGKQRPHSAPNHSDEMSTSHSMKTSAHQSSSKVQVVKRNTEEKRGSCDHVINNEHVFWFSSPKSNFLRAMRASFVTILGLCPQFLKSFHSQEGETGVLLFITSPFQPHLSLQ